MAMRIFIFVLAVLGAQSGYSGVSSGGGWGYMSGLDCIEKNPANPEHPLAAALTSYGKGARLNLTIYEAGYPIPMQMIGYPHTLYYGNRVMGTEYPPDCSVRCRFYESREDQVTFDLDHVGEEIEGTLNWPDKEPVSFTCKRP